MISMISESKNLIIQNCPQRNQGIKEINDSDLPYERPQ